MRWWRELTFIVRRLIHRQHAERELDEEINAHLELEIEQNVASGMSPEEARYAARRSFGSVALAKEDSRQIWGLRSLDILWQDLRYGLRRLFKSPGYCAVAVLSLGLGVGVNTTIFSLVNNALLRTVPVDNQEGLVYVYRSWANQRGFGSTSYLDYLDYCRRTTSFSGLAAYGHLPMAVTEQEQVQLVHAETVSGNYFSVLGIQPLIGRAFIVGEDNLSSPEAVVIISYALWKRRFDSDPRLIGRQISLNESQFTVIGIMPERFSGTEPALPTDIWVTIPKLARVANDRSSDSSRSWLSMIGRLKPGVTIEQAQAEMGVVIRNVTVEHNPEPKFQKTSAYLSPASNPDPSKLSLSDSGSKIWSLLIWTSIAILGATFLVLLTTCINIATLTLARTSVRWKENAIRLALGASRWRLIMQLLAENIVLALFCGAAGLILSYWARHLIRLLVPAEFVHFIPALKIDLRVAVFTIALSLVIGILFGLAPALRSSKPQLSQVLGGNIGLGREGRRGWNSPKILITFQVAVSFVLLIVGGLSARLLASMQAFGDTLKAQNILVTNLRTTPFRHELVGVAQKDCGELESKIRAIPGVQSVSISHSSPFGSENPASVYMGDGNLTRNISLKTVSSSYFQTMKFPVIGGREFSDRGDASSTRVVIVNKVAAESLWQGENPLGKLLRIDNSSELPREVIGVVSDDRDSFGGTQVKPLIYVPLNQELTSNKEKTTAKSRAIDSNLYLIVRSSFNTPKILIEPIRREIKSTNKNIPTLLLRFETLDELKDYELIPIRAGAVLFWVCGMLGLLVTTIGLYGLTSYTVVVRTREIGIRTALGAQRKNIVRLMVKEAAVISFVGIAVGLSVALAATRLLSSLLYGISSTDPVTYAAVSVFVALVVVTAFYIPARRATKINPLDALRYE